MLQDQEINFRRGYIFQEELRANQYSGREIGFVRVFSLFLMEHYLRNNEFGEVVHGELGEDLLANILRLF